MNILPLNQLDMRTKDNRYSQRDLIAKIKQIAHAQGHDNRVAQSAVNSFVNNGIVETYNELGYQEWMKLIYQVVTHEGAERSRASVQ